MYSKKIFFTLIIIFIFIYLPFSVANGGGTVDINNPLGKKNPDVNVMIGQVINAVLGVVGSLALIMFIYGGFTWMTAGGSQEKVRKGRDILVWAALGLIIIFSSYALVRFVLIQAIGGQADTPAEEG